MCLVTSPAQHDPRPEVVLNQHHLLSLDLLPEARLDFEQILRNSCLLRLRAGVSWHHALQAVLASASAKVPAQTLGALQRQGVSRPSRTLQGSFLSALVADGFNFVCCGTGTKISGCQCQDAKSNGVAHSPSGCGPQDLSGRGRRFGLVSWDL